MKKTIYCIAIFSLVFLNCTNNKEAGDMSSMSFIQQKAIDSIITALSADNGSACRARMEKGVKQAAFFWNSGDGTEREFEEFCKTSFIADPDTLDTVFNKLMAKFEALFGNFNNMDIALKRTLHVDEGEIYPIDEMFGAYDASSHITEDLFKNKIAFFIILNFPCYSLEEKNEFGTAWSRKEWAHARLGDLFNARVPADKLQKVSETLTRAEVYISEYNIYMGNLIDTSFRSLFPKDMKLISHWGLRDELKARYNQPEGLEKQRMIYEVMKRIIAQEIPQQVINSNELQWNPIQNKAFKEGKAAEVAPEPDTRYRTLLDNFLAVKEIDPYSPLYTTYIQRKFDEETEITQTGVEKLFRDFVGSPVIREAAGLISRRLGRPLEPFDIWYDGFKPRSAISEDELTEKVVARYTSRQDFENNMPAILKSIGFPAAKAAFIASRIKVDAARGSGHAWGAEMKSGYAFLRTRVTKQGMDYKGYNIAMHELGHTVEQTISLHDVDYYMLSGVPSTAFTEALAFNFQKKDLELLGIKNKDRNQKHLAALDNLWSTYEIMGVSLVDQLVWKWLYEHQNATPAALKAAVIDIAKQVWNKYYADVFGVVDQTILAIYSHMINDPLYLSAYPIGHLIEFQIDRYLEGKTFAPEVQRIFSTGRLTPQTWMKQAVGEEISIKASIEAAKEALVVLQ